MKILSVVNIVLCLVLATGIYFLVVKAERTLDRLDTLEAANAERTRSLSDDVSVAYTRIGELEARVRTLTNRMETVSARTSVEDVEYQVKQILEEDRKNRRQRWQGRMGGMGGMEELQNLKPEQRERAGKLMGKGVKDYLDLQAKIKAGEIPKEDEQKIIHEWIKENWGKFKEDIENENKQAQ